MFGKRSGQTKLSLLLVDADPGNIRSVREALDSSHFAVAIANDPKLGAKKLASDQYDCLLVDPEVFDSTGPRLPDLLRMAGPAAALVVLCRPQRSGLPADLPDLERVTFLDSEALRSPGLPQKIGECVEVAQAILHGQVDALVLPGAGAASLLLSPGSDRAYRALVETLQEGILTVDPSGTVVFTNQRAGEILRCDPDSLLGLDVLSLVTNEDQPLIRAKIEEALTGAASRCELPCAAPGQPPVHVMLSLSPIHQGNGSQPGVCLALTDLSEEKRLRDELQKLAITDRLTGLHTGRYLADWLTRECRRARRYGRDLSCLMLNLDEFKHCNELCGHVAGNELLRQVAALLKSSIRDTDIVARLGADQFCILLPETPLEGAMRLAERIRATIGERRFALGDRSLSSTVSIGVCSPGQKEDLQPEAILSSAETALREAKAAGKNRVHASR